jgi:hypothetical protein
MMAAVAFGNATSLPFVFLTTVRDQLSYLFQVSGTKTQLTDAPTLDPVVYLSIYLLVYPIVQWVGGDWLLGGSPQSQQSNLPENNSRMDAAPADGPLNAWMAPELQTALQSSEARAPASALASASNLLGAVAGEQEALQVLSQRNTRGSMAMIQLTSHALVADPGGAGDDFAVTAKPGRWSKICHACRSVLERLLIPPVIGTLLGVLMGTLPPTYWLFCGGTYPQRAAKGESCPSSSGAVLGWLTQAIATLGNAAGVLHS